MATASTNPGLSVSQILAKIASATDTLPEPTRTEVKKAEDWLESAIKAEADAAIVALANKVPIAGGVIGEAIEAGFNKVLDSGLVQITS